MRQRIKERAVPTDSEVLSYDNAPVDVAARYLDWPEQTVRLPLREGRATFGVAVQGKGLTYKISPGGGELHFEREPMSEERFGTVAVVAGAPSGCCLSLSFSRLSFSEEVCS